jgi:hypothetical protein
LAVAEKRRVPGAINHDGGLVHYSPCHPRAGLRLLYTGMAVLHLECEHCGELVMRLAIANRPPE